MSLPVAIEGKVYFGILAQGKRSNKTIKQKKNQNNNNNETRKFVVTFS